MTRYARYIDAYMLSDMVFKSKIDNPHIDVKIRRTHNHEHDHFLKMIANTPTADVVEVVRCKDCKYCFDAVMGGMWCEHPDKIMPLGSNPDDFCSYGERGDIE